MTAASPQTFRIAVMALGGQGGGVLIDWLVDLAEHAGWTGGLIGLVRGIDINTAGFAIVGIFVVTWAVSLAVWHLAGIEERWQAAPADGPVPADTPLVGAEAAA